MSKLKPEELWRRHTLERQEAFKQSNQVKILKKEGLAACGRKKMFAALEWARSPMNERYLSSQYMEWHNKCEEAARRFGLETETIICICLIRGYKSDKQVFPVELHSPHIRLVTENSDSQYLARLGYEAQSRGLRMIVRQGFVDTNYLLMNPVPIQLSEPPPLPESMPPMYNAFFIQVETPILYPSQAATQLQEMASRLEKDILTALGYRVPKRLRSSKLVPKASKYRVNKDQLGHRGLHKIVADIYDEGSESEDQKRLKTVKTQRNKLRNRLVKPFEKPEPKEV
jgi:hypothetical protein